MRALQPLKSLLLLFVSCSDRRAVPCTLDFAIFTLFHFKTVQTYENVNFSSGRIQSLEMTGRLSTVPLYIASDGQRLSNHLLNTPRHVVEDVFGRKCRLLIPNEAFLLYRFRRRLNFNPLFDKLLPSAIIVVQRQEIVLECSSVDLHTISMLSGLCMLLLTSINQRITASGPGRPKFCCGNVARLACIAQCDSITATTLTIFVDGEEEDNRH